MRTIFAITNVLLLALAAAPSFAHDRFFFSMSPKTTASASRRIIKSWWHEKRTRTTTTSTRFLVNNNNNHDQDLKSNARSILHERVPRGGSSRSSSSSSGGASAGRRSWMAAGWNPFGYKLTARGEEFLSYHGSTESDIGRFLSSLKQRKRFQTLKDQWLEVVRVAKTGQSMRIYRKLEDLIQFCLKAGFID